MWLAEKGDEVEEGDTVLSKENGYAQLIMKDEGFIAIRPDTKLRIDTFQYDGSEDGTERSVLFLIKGGFRALTGVIGRTNKDNYKIKTPVAVIGIRGTDHEPMFIPEPSEGEIPAAEPGVYDKVNVGQAYIQNEVGEVMISANEVGFAADEITPPMTLAEIPGFYGSPSASTDGEEEEAADSSEEQGEQDQGEESEDEAAGNEEPEEGLDASILSNALEPMPDEIYIPPIEEPEGWPDLTDLEIPSYRVVGFAAYDPRSSDPPHALVEGMSNEPDWLTTDSSGNLLGFDGNLPVIGGAYEDRDHAHLEIGSSTLADTGSDPIGISWGRWSGGTITATDPDTGASISPVFTPPDLHYIMGPEMNVPVVLPVSGTYAYSLVGGTNPTDNLGNVGTLNSASLTAYFDQMTVDAGVNVSVGTVTLDASASGIPILDASSSFSLNRDGPGFAAGLNEPTALNVTCSGAGCGTDNGGILGGGFIGPGGNGAGIAYSLNTNDGGSVDTTISGVAAFKRN